MSLSEDVRAELAAIAPQRRCDRLAELSALFHSAGSIHLLGRGRVGLHLDVGSSATARRSFMLLRELAVDSEIRTYRRHAFDRPTRFQLHIRGDAGAIATLAEAGVVDRGGRPLDHPPRRVVRRPCCRGAYFRGAFLGGGSLSGRRSPHLELRTPATGGATFLRDVAAREGIRLGLAERPRHAAAYAKSWDTIETLLGLAGAVDAVLALEERAVVAATRAQANRLANADHANLVRTTRAAQEQLVAARTLRERGALQRLPSRLREAAELRLRHPTLPLAELARRAEPPASKAGMQRRLARVVDLARR
jgi:cell division protein WhiA